MANKANIRIKSSGTARLSELQTLVVSLDKPKTTLPFIGGWKKSRVNISKLSKFLKACFEFWG